MKKINWPSPEIFLVTGLAYVFLFFGYQKIFMTDYWVGWIPGWMEGLMGMSKMIWTQVIGVFEVIFGIGLIIPKTRTIIAALIVLHLLAIIIMTGFSDIGIRDTGLLLMTLALLASRFKK